MSEKKKAAEGYTFVSYGKEKYLGHVIASIFSLRRYDTKRPVAIVCDAGHVEILRKTGLDKIFSVIHQIDNKHCSIVGFKHHLDKFLFFKRNIFLDSDMIWCKNPDQLWASFKPYSFTITGRKHADVFFGAPKGLGILKVILLNQRQKTLRRFGLNYLSRVQSGVIYASSKKITKKVCRKARKYLSQIDQTHFQSRLKEDGRSMESCEWSLAMAMSKMDLAVYPWMIGENSAQLDFISNYTEYDDLFLTVKCKFYSDSFVYSLRGLQLRWLQTFLTKVAGLVPGKNNFSMVTPYILHFGWLHEKKPFLQFADQIYAEIKSGKRTLPIQNQSIESQNVDTILEIL